jgi:aminoglycoside 3-N-acetyltransferase
MSGDPAVTPHAIDRDKCRESSLSPRWHCGRQEIVAGLKALGVRPGCILLVHASLSSLGTVEGGADTVIAALLEVLGPDGTLLMPTHPARDGRVFDPATVPSAMGRISEAFRQRPGVLRSRHPYHPVATCGPLAAQMLQDHPRPTTGDYRERSSIPDGPASPYGRLISLGGYVLHIGCDLDTLTLVHSVEAELDLPFLRELDMDYLGEDGQVHRLHLTRCPGGHRGGVLKFDRLLREEGAMVVGRIGQAVCRLIAARPAAHIMRRVLAHDPSFVLDNNPNCADCARARGQLKAARLAREDFHLTTVLYPCGLRGAREDLDKTLTLIQSEGIAAVEIEAAVPGAWNVAPEALCRQLEQHGMRAIGLRVQGAAGDIADWFRAAAELGADWVRVSIPVPPPPDAAWQDNVRTMLTAATGNVQLLLALRGAALLSRAGELARGLAAIGAPQLGVSYNPADIARDNGSPFYGGLYSCPLRRFVRHVELQDAVAGSEQIVPLGQGNAEIVEIISALRCRSYGGCLCLWPPPQQGAGAFRQAAAAFWHIMDHI